MCVCAYVQVYVHEYLRIFICCVLWTLLTLLVLYFIFFSYVHLCLFIYHLSHTASSLTIICTTLFLLLPFFHFFLFLFFPHTYVRTFTGHSVSKDTKSVQSTTLNPDFFSFYEFSTTLPGPSLLKVSRFRDIDCHCFLITNKINYFFIFTTSFVT